MLQQEKVTAPYLAEKFEVSRRTVNRDIESLAKSGIPIVTEQGHNGGISIMDGYRIDKTLLTNEDMRSILTGLKSLDSISGTNKYRLLMDKLSVKSNDNSASLASNEHILIDLSTWHKSSISPKIELIQSAIDNSVTVSFRYFSPSGESEREIEPYLLLFKWSSWYVWGYCLKRNDYRLFKLNRLSELKKEHQITEKHPYKVPDLSSESMFPSALTIKAVFEPNIKWRLIDDYGIDSFTELDDGRLLFIRGCSDKYSLFTWLLTFGPSVELLEPENLRSEFSEFAQKISDIYKG